jgi:outer membrane protein TolC
VLTLTLKDALDHRRQYGQQFLQANTAALLARETAVQARVALFPTVKGFSHDYSGALAAEAVARAKADVASRGLFATVAQNYYAMAVGSVAQAQTNVPVWTWGASRSRVSQAELQLPQAQYDLSFTQRQLLSELQSFYAEAQVAAAQVEPLRRSEQQSAESLRLTLLRYQTGEVTVLDVVDAQATLTQARNASDDGLVRYRLALANLQTLTGGF